MTDVTPPPETKPHIVTGASGCGLAAYAALLLAICLTGVVGMVLSTRAILTQQPDSVSKLVHGSQVATWRLQPMRDAQLLQLTEVPNAWHDQSPMRDGTRCCALTDAGIAILDENAITIPFHSITEVGVEAGEGGHFTVTIMDANQTGSCVFGPGEGSDRFVRQINVERNRGQDPKPANTTDPKTD